MVQGVEGGADEEVLKEVRGGRKVREERREGFEEETDLDVVVGST